MKNSLDDYKDQYETIEFERHDGILQMTLHTGGGSLQWGPICQAEIVDALTRVGADRKNRMIILTGKGDDFIGPRAQPGRSFYREVSSNITPELLDAAHWNAKRVMTRHLDIEVPMIAVVNGPAMRHAEIALMCDIIIASDTASFEDSAHFKIASQTPGDGVSIVYTMLLGLNRARYFLLTGQIIGAEEALQLGLVNEVMPRADCLPRAWELARELAKKPDLLLRYTRMTITQPLKTVMDEQVSYHLAMESLAKLDKELVISDGDEIERENDSKD